jgi:tRNA threonylcarbamoyladenosine biosynthesis protein TsaE
MTSPVTLTTHSADETRKVGEGLGRRLSAGDVLLLHGDLGSGKTTLTQGIARGLGIEEYVQSPTFTLVAEHTGSSPSGEPLRLYHIDLYRLSGEEDLPSFGYEQYLAPVDGATVIEWPERAGSMLPDRYLLITLEPIGPDTRRLVFQPSAAEHQVGQTLNLLCDESRV